MKRSDHAPTIIAFILTIVVALMLSFIINHPARAEGSTFINVFRQAGTHRVDICTGYSTSYISSCSDWMTLTDIGSDYVCGLATGRLWCIPINNIQFVWIEGVSSLPSGGQ